MAKGDRKGLPSKRTSVIRKTKTGKVSTYVQSYYVNPFKKNSKKQTGKQQDTSIAGKIVEKMTKLPAIDKRISIEGMLQGVNPHSDIGTLKSTKIASKIKTTKEAAQLSEGMLSQSLTSLSDLSNPIVHQRIKEHGKILNNILPNQEVYSTLINTLASNKSSMPPEAFSSLMYSFQNHSMVENVLFKKSNKKESYDIDEMAHDWHVEHTNPLNHVINYYGINNGDQLKSSIIDLYKLPNDLRYLNNGVQMTEQEVAKNQKWIDFNNDEVMKVAAGGLLQKFIYIEIDKNVAAMVTNSPSTFNFNLYNSTIYEFKDAAETLSDTEWKKIKDVQVTNNTNFTIHQSAFYIQRETKKVFFIAKVSIKNVGDYNFLSLAQKDTGNFLDRYSDHILKSANTSLLSKMELREKVDALSERYKELPNYNSYLLM